MAGTLIGDAIIRIVVDPSAAVAAVSGQKGSEKPRPAERSEKPAKRSDGEGSENEPTEEDVFGETPEELARQTTKEDKERRRRKSREDAEAKRAKKKKRKSPDDKADDKARETEKKEKARSASRGKAARMAIAGRATRRLLNRTVPVIGRASTIGIQATQTVAPAFGIKAAGIAGGGVGAAAGIAMGATVYGHQINQFLTGLAGRDVGNITERVALQMLAPGLTGGLPPGMQDAFAGFLGRSARVGIDLISAARAGISEHNRVFANAGVVSELGGKALDGAHAERMAVVAMRNAINTSRYYSAFERTVEGVSSKGVGSGFASAVRHLFSSGNAQR